MECPKCTAENHDDAIKCRLCGGDLRQPETPDDVPLTVRAEKNSQDALRLAVGGLREQIDSTKGLLFVSLSKLSDALAEVEKNLVAPLTVSAAEPEPAKPEVAIAKKISPVVQQLRIDLRKAQPETPAPAEPSPSAAPQEISPPVPPPLPPLEPEPVSVLPAPVKPADTQPPTAPAEPQQEEILSRFAPKPLPVKPAADAHQSGIAELHIGQKWLLYVGIAITVLGVGYFLNLAFQNNWIPPAGRVAMAFALGGVFLGAGEWFRRKGENLLRFGLPLIGCGVVILYFSTFAAYQIYELIGQGPAFGLMALITAFTGILSLKYDSRALAVVGLIGGFTTPLLLSTGTNSYHTLFIYITILNAGVVWLSFHKRWSLLNILGFIFTWLIFSGWFFRWYDSELFWPAIIYLNIFFAIYALVPYAYYFRHKASAQLGGLSLSIINSFIAFGYAFGMIQNHPVWREYHAASLVSLLYAGVFFWMAHDLYRRQPENRRSLIMTLAMGLLFLTITVPILFSGHWITIFWMAEGTVVLWAALKLDSVKLRWTAVILLAVVFGKFVLHDYAHTFGFNLHLFRYRPHYDTLLLSRYFTTAVSLGALYAAARLLRKNFTDESKTFIIAFGISLFALLTAEVSGFFADYNPGARAASVSVLWSLFSIALMVIGFGKKNAACRYTAIGLFAFTALKVLLSDMAHVSTPFRVLSCVILGILLIGASYLYYRYSEVLMPKDADRQPENSPEKKS